MKELFKICDKNDTIYILRGYVIKSFNNSKIETELMDTYESEEIAMETIKKSMYWEPNTNIYQYKDKKLKGLKNISLSKKMKLIKNDKTDNVIFIWGKDCNLIKDNRQNSLIIIKGS